MNLPQLYNTQISLPEWFEQIGHKKTQHIRDEDLTRQTRLKTLNEITGLPYDKPEIFNSDDVLNNTEKFKIFFERELSKNTTSTCKQQCNYRYRNT